MSEQLRDIWESAVEFKVLPDESLVDGINILARVEGPAFFPGAVSDNNVEYPEEIWDSVLEDPELADRLRDRMVLGTIGHDLKMDDAAVREGLASHITIRMWVGDDGIGRAEYLILNTKTGRVLNTLLRAGCKLRVSTKAKGTFHPTLPNGVRKLRGYLFERIDFVTVPGFLDALPEVKESLDEALKDGDTHQQVKEDNSMQELIDLLKSQLSGLQVSVNESKEENGTLRTQLTAVNESLATLTTQIGAYQAIGTAEEINEALTSARASIQKLTGQLKSATARSAAEIQLAEEVEESLNAYRDLGTPEEITQLLDVMESLHEEKEAKLISDMARKHKVGVSVVKGLLSGLNGDFQAVNEALSEECMDDEDDVNEEEEEEEDKKEDKKDGDEEGKKDGDDEEDKKDDKSDVSEALNRQSRLNRLTTGLMRANISSTSGKPADVNEDKNKATKPSGQSRVQRLMGQR